MTLDQWLAWQETFHPNSIDLGLTRVKRVADAMGVCHFSCPVITVGGTNGKGSCCAILEAIFLEAGLKVGLYTSPHLLKYNERIRINGVPVSDEVLCQAFEVINQQRQEMSLTYFEFGTLAALYLFQQKTLDVIILEVGLGGRLDAVNIIDADVAVITTIDLDHQQWLGDNRESIGYEKSGIFRFQKPVVCADLSPPKSLLEQAQKLKSPFYNLGKDFSYQRQKNAWSFQSTFKSMEALPLPSLLLSNASAALMAIQCLNLPVTQDAIRNALKKVTLMGRFQRLKDKPLIMADVAHNPQSAKMLAKLLQQQGEMETFALVAMMKDKDIQGTLTPLIPFVSQWFVCDLPLERAASTEDLLQCLQQLSVSTIKAYETVLKACDDITPKLNANQRLVIFGSFFIVAPALLYYQELQKNTL